MACIYKISVADEFYIGSTDNFEVRKYHHIKTMKKSKLKLYQAIRDNDYEFVMEKLHDYDCETDEELRMEERRVYDEMKPTLNRTRPHITKEDKVAYKKQYQQENKEKIALKQKEKYENRTIEEQQNDTLRRKQYRIDNKEKLSQKNRAKCVCECGFNGSIKHMKRHKSSPIHTRNMECVAIMGRTPTEEELKKWVRLRNNQNDRDKYKNRTTEKQDKDKQYRLENAEKIKAQRNQYQLEHAEELKARRRQIRQDKKNGTFTDNRATRFERQKQKQSQTTETK